MRAYYAENALVPARPAAAKLLLFPKNPLLQSLFASLLPYLELEQHLPEKLLAVKITEVIEILRSLDPHSDGVLAVAALPHPKRTKPDTSGFWGSLHA